MTGWFIYYWPGTEAVLQVVMASSDLPVPDGATFMPEEDGPPPEPVGDPAMAEANEFSILTAKQRQANLQITAIQGRVDAINDAISYDEALPEEIVELPVRNAQLDTWKRYRIKLGRVTTIDGWYQTPTYPVVPEPYTAETSKSSDV